MAHSNFISKDKKVPPQHTETEKEEISQRNAITITKSATVTSYNDVLVYQDDTEKEEISQSKAKQPQSPSLQPFSRPGQNCPAILVSTPGVPAKEKQTKYQPASLWFIILQHLTHRAITIKAHIFIDGNIPAVQISCRSGPLHLRQFPPQTISATTLIGDHWLFRRN